MNILFLTYWQLGDALTITTVLPHVEILSAFKEVNKIVVCTPEIKHEDGHSATSVSPKITYNPLYQKESGLPIWSHWRNQRDTHNQLVKLIKDHKINLVIARSSMAGSQAYKLWVETRTPFIVESLEPHADYMLECGIWSRYNLKYILQKYWEGKQHEAADYLIPCAHTYKSALVKAGVTAQKIEVIPCCVPLERFAFNPFSRLQVRTQIGIPSNAIVGVYLGKFGGVYYAEDSFRIFEEAFRHFGNSYHQLILSPQSEKELLPLIQNKSIPQDRLHIRFVQHSLVPAFLSASDFAYSPIVYSPSQLYRSLIKNGEYWASGIPILQTEGVGDDSEIISRENAGANFRIEKWSTVRSGLKIIEQIVSDTSHRTRLMAIAARERNFIIAKAVYQKVLQQYF